MRDGRAAHYVAKACTGTLIFLFSTCKREIFIYTIKLWMQYFHNNVEMLSYEL